MWVLLEEKWSADTQIEYENSTQIEFRDSWGKSACWKDIFK